MNAARLAALVLVAMPVMTLGVLDASAVSDVVFVPALVEKIVKELIVAPCDIF